MDLNRVNILKEDNSSLKFPLYGLKLNFLHLFIDAFHLRTNFLLEKTTSQICEAIIKPLTSKRKCSFCDLILANDKALLNRLGIDQGEKMVGTATVFISHAWTYNFIDVVEAIFHHFEVTDYKSEPFIWFDIFSYNQHDLSSHDSDWLSVSFKEAIGRFQNTVMILAPWRDPVPLTRAWCIWELYCTIKTEARFEIAMNRSQHEEFIRDMSEKGVKSLDQMLAVINTEKSQACVKEDSDLIHSVVKSTIGFDALNSKIFEKMREWYFSAVEEEIHRQEQLKEEGHEHEERKIWELKRVLAKLHSRLENHSIAFDLYVECIKNFRRILGDGDKQLLEVMWDILDNYQDQKEGELKIMNIYEEVYHSNVSIFGEFHLHSLLALNNLAQIYGRAFNLEKALPLLEKLCSISESTRGLSDKYTLQFLSSTAESLKASENPHLTKPRAMYYFKKLIQAQQLLPDGFEESRGTRNNFAVMLLEMNRTNEAIPIYQELIEEAQIKLGENHPSMIRYRAGLSGAYCTLGLHEQVFSIVEDCFHKRSMIFGKDHFETISSMNRLAMVYIKQERFEDAIQILEENRSSWNKRSHKLRVLDIYITAKDGLFLRDNPLALASSNRNEHEHEHENVKDDHRAPIDIHYQETEKLLFDYIEEIQIQFPHDNRLRWDTMIQLASLLIKHEKYSRSENILHQIIQEREIKLGKKVFELQTDASYALLAEIYLKQNRLEEAELKLIELLQFHPLIGWWEIKQSRLLGEVYRKQQKYDLAEKRSKECVELLDTHYHSLEALESLGLLYLEMKQYSLGKAVLEDCFSRRVKILGKDHPMTRKTEELLLTSFKE